MRCGASGRVRHLGILVGVDDTDAHARSTAARPLEDTVVTDLEHNLSYGEYLDLERVLGAQHTRAVPPRHDELLFIIQHQTSELWLKLILHELDSARALLQDDAVRPALKRLARVKHIQVTLTEQWSVLATLTPSEYAQFRSFLATGSGFQSWQYRLVEFVLGNRSPEMVRVFAHDEAIGAALTAELARPSLYDVVLAHLARLGYAVPRERLDRDWSRPVASDPALTEVLAGIYADPEAHWDTYELCEALVDVEDNMQVWRFRHLRTVERIIGSKRGTGGSSGVPFLRRALEQTFFPELYDVRSRMQDVAPPGYHGEGGTTDVRPAGEER